MYNDRLKILPKIYHCNRETGICFHLAEALDTVISNRENEVLKEEMHSFLRFKGWHSGCNTYPINIEDGCSVDARNMYQYGGNLWNTYTSYGQRRWATYLHLDQYLCELRSGHVQR